MEEGEGTSSSTAVDYRELILTRLDQRNVAVRKIERIFKNYASLVDELSQAKHTRLRSQTSSDLGGGASSEEVQRLRDELTDLYRNKGINDQSLIDAKRKLEEAEQRLAKSHSTITRLEEDNGRLRSQMAELHVTARKAREDCQTVRDECISLKALVESQKTKIAQLEQDEVQLIDKIRALNEQHAAMMNNEIDKQVKRQEKRVQDMIATAIQDDSRDAAIYAALAETNAPLGNVLLGDAVPYGNCSKFDANEGEVLDVLWLTSEQCATAGSDRMIRIFQVSPSGRVSKSSTLAGCNQAVTRLDYLGDETRHLMGSSNDCNVRIWNIDNQRIVTTLSGHSDKVSAARFFGPAQAISGSSDRTIKIWEIRSCRCIKSFFPGSTILDLVPMVTGGGQGFVSGHFDKSVRFWDGRCADAVKTIPLGGRVTSLDAASDGYQLLCSTRDDTLSLIDIRRYSTVHIYSAEQYRNAADTSRCVISPGMDYCAAGSSDGSVFIWNLNTTKIEKILHKGGHEHSVMSLSWNPSGRGLLSADKVKTVCFWS